MFSILGPGDPDSPLTDTVIGDVHLLIEPTRPLIDLTYGERAVTLSRTEFEVVALVAAVTG